MFASQGCCAAMQLSQRNKGNMRAKKSVTQKVPQKCDKALLFCQELYESYST
jgi:hypothetical protein